MKSFKWFYKVYLPGLIFWIFLIQVSPKVSPPYMEQFEDSFFYSNKLFLILGTCVFSFFVFWHLTKMFKKFRNLLPQNTLLAGMAFGFSFGILWFLGFLEYHYFFGSNLKNGIISGLTDLTSLFFVGTLISYYSKQNFKENIVQSGRDKALKFNLTDIFIPICFTLGRFVFYKTTSVEIRDITFYGMFLEFLLGVGLYFVYTYYLSLYRQKNIDLNLKNKLYVIGIFIGLNWIMYNLYPLLRRDIPFKMMGPLIGIDILALVSAVILSNMFLRIKAK